MDDDLTFIYTTVSEELFTEVFVKSSDKADWSGVVNEIFEPKTILQVDRVLRGWHKKCYLSLVCISALTSRLRGLRKSHSNENAESPGVISSGSFCMTTTLVTGVNKKEEQNVFRLMHTRVELLKQLHKKACQNIVLNIPT
uniref:Uncharacterized protein n=1 Tax=Glossina pallidipes TaxID=7398 RepID=A0A1A9Z9V8_GLOPL